MTGQNSIIGLKWLTDLTLQMKTANKLCRMIWFQVGAVILRVAEGDGRWRWYDGVAHRAELLILHGTEETQRGGIEMQEVSPQPKLLDGLDRNGCHEPIGDREQIIEHLGEPLLGEIRAAYGPQYCVNLEKLIDATPGGREKVAGMRERFKAIRAQMAARASQATGS